MHRDLKNINGCLDNRALSCGPPPLYLPSGSYAAGWACPFDACAAPARQAWRYRWTHIESREMKEQVPVHVSPGPAERRGRPRAENGHASRR
jgi:hypothetical protein